MHAFRVAGRGCVPWLAVLALSGALATAASADVPVPPLKARVTDLTGTLNGSERDALERKLAAFEAKKGSQIAVLLVPTTQPETIEQYGIRVGDAWKIGRKGVDDGAILIVAKNDRRLRIEVGYGLEGALPDARAKQIVSDIITPYFKRGDFAGGIDAGVDAMIKVIDGEPLPAVTPQPSAGGSITMPDMNTLMVIGIITVIIGRLLRATLGRAAGAGLTAGTIGLVVWGITGLLTVAVIAAIIVFVLSLLGGGLPVGPGMGRGGGWRGGGGGSWSSGGGGFSGGGGSFGGGGSSGSW